MNHKDAIRKHIQELHSIENMLSKLEQYSDDWFVWNELRLEEERKIRCCLMDQKRFEMAARNKQR